MEEKPDSSTIEQIYEACKAASEPPSRDQIFEVCKEAGSWPRLWPEIKDPHECHSVARELAGLRKEYEIENDPLALLEAISLTYREFFAMPSWAHAALAEASQKYLFAHGEIDFDELIKLKEKRKGPTNSAFKRRIKQWQYREAAFHVWLLHKGLNFTLPISCLIASKLPHFYANFGKEISINFSASHLEDIYASASYSFKTESPYEEWFGDDPIDHLNYYIVHYESAFQALVNSGEFWQRGLLKSAERARQKLFANAYARLKILPK